jgi:hypothetical protein
MCVLGGRATRVPHRTQVVGVLGQLGGHDELVAGGDRLGVIALPGAVAGVQEAALGVGDVGGRLGVGGLVARPGLELPRRAAVGGRGGGAGGDPLRIPLLARGRLRLQPSLGLAQPAQPARPWRPARRAARRHGRRRTAGPRAGSVSAACLRISPPRHRAGRGCGWPLSAALPASLVPSNATPTRTMPAAAHSFKDWMRKPARACSWRARKRAMVTWSGTWLAASTRKAMPSLQRRSIWREDRTPRQ